MSFYKRLDEIYREVVASPLVKTGELTPENLLAFQNTLNKSWPTTPEEQVQRDFVRNLYYRNPVGFLTYVSLRRNRAGSLVLWTESKRIAVHFGLAGKVHISWSEDTHSYTVALHMAETRNVKRAPTRIRKERPTRNTQPVERTNRNKLESLFNVHGAKLRWADVPQDQPTDTTTL